MMKPMPNIALNSPKRRARWSLGRNVGDIGHRHGNIGAGEAGDGAADEEASRDWMRKPGRDS